MAIVDYGLGNLFSVRNACEHVGLESDVTSSRERILSADAVILPGVGAFGDAMDSLRRLDLISPMIDIASSEKPLVGICLGMQLLMAESSEFGNHRGLGVIPGSVVRFSDSRAPDVPRSKVPQVGWNRVFRARPGGDGLGRVDPWQGSPLEDIDEGAYLYFIHSFYARPADDAVVLSVSRYANIEFCSAVRHRNVFAFQFHPERSGSTGLAIYGNLAKLVECRRTA